MYTNGVEMRTGPHGRTGWAHRKIGPCILQGYKSADFTAHDLHVLSGEIAVCIRGGTVHNLAVWAVGIPEAVERLRKGRTQR